MWNDRWTDTQDLHVFGSLRSQEILNLSLIILESNMLRIFIKASLTRLDVTNVCRCCNGGASVAMSLGVKLDQVRGPGSPGDRLARVTFRGNNYWYWMWGEWSNPCDQECPACHACSTTLGRLQSLTRYYNDNDNEADLLKLLRQVGFYLLNY